jgi:hypothetical protein
MGRRLLQALGVLFFAMAAYECALALQLAMLPVPTDTTRMGRAEIYFSIAIAYVGVGTALLAAARR